VRFLKVSVFVSSDKMKQNIFAHNSIDFTCPHSRVFFRFQKSSGFSSVHTRNGTELRNDVFSKHFTSESIFGRFGVDNGRKRINMYAFSYENAWVWSPWPYSDVLFYQNIALCCILALKHKRRRERHDNLNHREQNGKRHTRNPR